MLPKPWRRGEGRGAVSKAVGAWPRPWGRDQDFGGVAKAMRAFQGRGGMARGLGA